MSLYEFKSHERLDGKTIAESNAELSASNEYILWVEQTSDSKNNHLHFQHIDREYIPPADQALIETVAAEAAAGFRFMRTDGHAIVSVKRWTTPDGEVAGADELLHRLVEVM